MFDLHAVVSVVALCLSLVGNLLINFKKRIGFLVWIGSNILWIVVSLISVQPNWPQIMMFSVYIILSGHGWWQWARKD